ncbi:MAG: hypothetical protein IKD89_07995 [Clostridia bacterium]|nr:hypothetical protein [Clostridia bacterium]
MKIEAITCLPTKTDGTLLIKTEMDHAEEGLRYCFYVYKGSERIHKTNYSQKSFTTYRVPAYGKYQIKAFVKNEDGSEKVDETVSFVVNKSNAKDLIAAQQKEKTGIEIKDALKGEGIIVAEISGETAEGFTYAWYLYRAGEKDPVMKTPYADNKLFACKVDGEGEYFVKLFAKKGTDKFTVKSDAVKF